MRRRCRLPGFGCGGSDGAMRGDPLMIRRAISNLLSNALRHTPDHGHVHIQLTRTPESTVIAVENTGETIPEQHLPRLFDRFYRVDPSRAQPGDSGGLGLAIVQSIMHLHGGQVQVRSDAQGTLFELGFSKLENSV